jgi:hypothetical protein
LGLAAQREVHLLAPVGVAETAPHSALPAQVVAAVVPAAISLLLTKLVSRAALVAVAAELALTGVWVVREQVAKVTLAEKALVEILMLVAVAAALVRQEPMQLLIKAGTAATVLPRQLPALP